MTHLAVIGLVVTTAALGVRVAGSGAPIDRGFPFNLIGIARGADAGTFLPRTITAQLTPDPQNVDLPLSRQSTRYVPDPTPPPTPLPTPVAPPAPVVFRLAPPPPAPIVGNGMLLWPVSGGTITQYYWASHLALDIAKPAGSPVIAAKEGTVVWAGWRNNGGGLVVQIDHGDGIQTVYNHLDSIDVAVGAVVTAGQTIAAVGCTGTCTGPHVHFAVLVNGVFVNPLRYL